MSIRGFRLVNSKGEAYDLNNLDHFLHDPEGLGYQSAIEYQRIGHRYLQLNDELQQGSVSGMIRFREPGAYIKYAAFAKFCQKKPLQLYYTSDQEYQTEVIPTIVDKREIEEIGLDVGVTFTKLDYWNRRVAVSNDGTGEDGKKYSYTYPFTYADQPRGIVSIDSDTELESPCVIYIYGPVEDPVWRHYLNGELKTQGAVNATIAQGNKLVIDTTSIPYRIVETDSEGNVVDDHYQNSDFSLGRFVYFGAGKNRITVGGHGATIPAVTVEAHLLYDTV